MDAIDSNPFFKSAEDWADVYPQEEKRVFEGKLNEEGVVEIEATPLSFSDPQKNCLIEAVYESASSETPPITLANTTSYHNALFKSPFNHELKLRDASDRTYLWEEGNCWGFHPEISRVLKRGAGGNCTSFITTGKHRFEGRFSIGTFRELRPNSYNEFADQRDAISNR